VVSFGRCFAWRSPEMKRLLIVLLLALLGSFCAWSYLGGGIVNLLLDPGIPSELRLLRIQDYFEAWGPAGPLAYGIVVTIEVILAPIPGTLLYLPGGVIFGWFVGGTASLAGNVMGAGIACQVMRVLGGPYLESYLERSAIRKYQAFIERRGFWFILLLRVNPLTSSDLVSYAAGLTHLSVWKVMLATLFGMAPLCFVQAYFAQEIFTILPALIYPLILIGLLYVVYVVKIIRQLAGKRIEQIVPEMKSAP
jgi:uncharacterized membrane protein YdjX (TVP38/TMEM64 family)